jgi:predicted nucleotidyltransferase
MTRFEPPIIPHQELNPRLWDHAELKPEVQVALLRIAREFWKFLEIDAKITDIVISGSQANYNYTSHSDIDLHLIVPMGDIQCDEPIEALFDTKRRLWKLKHTIDIYGIPVECYAEDQARPAVSSSYSLLTNTWIREPDPSKIEYNQQQVKHSVKVWTTLILHAVQTRDLTELERLTELLITYRKVGLAKQGEFGTANLTFKSLRNAGLLDRLHLALNTIKDSNLSLD